MKIIKKEDNLMKYLVLFVLINLITLSGKLIASDSDKNKYIQFRKSIFNYDSLNFKKISCSLDGFALDFSIKSLKRKLNKLGQKYSVTPDSFGFYFDNKGYIKFNDFKFDILGLDKNDPKFQGVMKDLESINESIRKIKDLVTNTFDDLFLENFNVIKVLSHKESDVLEFKINDDGIVRTVRKNKNVISDKASTDRAEVNMTKKYEVDPKTQKLTLSNLTIKTNVDARFFEITSEITYTEFDGIKVPTNISYNHRGNMEGQFSMFFSAASISDCVVTK